MRQEDDVPGGVGFLDVRQHLLEHTLCPTVWVGALPFGALLGDGYLGGVAVNGGAGGEDDVFAAMAAHHVDQHECAADVVFVVLPWFRDALAHGFESGEVDAGVEVMLGEHSLQTFTVADVGVVEGYAVDSDDLRHSAQGLGVGVAEVVDDYGSVACLIQLYQCVGADVSGSAGN